MTVLERKNHLHQLIVETNNDVILEKVEHFFEQLLSDVSADWSDMISADEKKSDSSRNSRYSSRAYYFS